jgi:hypothetical protein
LTFATTGHGDRFCFDIRKGTKEFAVFIFKHEYNCFEPYAENFAACMKRFAGGGVMAERWVKQKGKPPPAPRTKLLHLPDEPAGVGVLMGRGGSPPNCFTCRTSRQGLGF